MSPLTNRTFRITFVETRTYGVDIAAPEAAMALDFAQCVYDARESEPFSLLTRSADTWTVTDTGEAVK